MRLVPAKGVGGEPGRTRNTGGAPVAQDRTLPRQLPRKRLAATSRYPRVRWWRIACDHLWRLMMDPVAEWSDGDYRGVDMLDSGGVRIHRSTGTVSYYALRQRGRWLVRDHDVYQQGMLLGDPGGNVWIGGLVNIHAKHWARLAQLPPEHITRQWNRLLSVMPQRWSREGILARMLRMEERALALDEDAVRLARATSRHQFGRQAVFQADYMRCLADRANLLTLEREAPQLLRLYTLLLPAGAGDTEPKQALKRAFLDGGRRTPRLWRMVHRLDVAAIDALTEYSRCAWMDPLIDWIDLLQALDLPFQAPLGWMLGMRRSFGFNAFSRDFDLPWARLLFTAHVAAWMAADEEARGLLFLELEDACQILLNLAVPPVPPSGPPRGWPWCVRWVAKMEAAQFESEAQAARAWDEARGLPRQRPARPLRGARIELQPLQTSAALCEEGRAMENCVHDWRDRLVDGTAAIYSVRLVRTGEHIGTAAIEVEGLLEIKGRGHRALAPEHRREAALLLMRESPKLWPEVPAAPETSDCVY